MNEKEQSSIVWSIPPRRGENKTIEVNCYRMHLTSLEMVRRKLSVCRAHQHLIQFHIYTCDRKNKGFVIASFLYLLSIELLYIYFCWCISSNSSSLPCSHFVRFYYYYFFVSEQYQHTQSRWDKVSAKVRQWFCCFSFLH